MSDTKIFPEPVPVPPVSTFDTGDRGRLVPSLTGGERQRLRLVSYFDGYCVVRVKGCGPFIMAAKDWAALPLWEDGL